MRTQNDIYLQFIVNFEDIIIVGYDFMITNMMVMIMFIIMTFVIV